MDTWIHPWCSFIENNVKGNSKSFPDWLQKGQRRRDYTAFGVTNEQMSLGAAPVIPKINIHKLMCKWPLLIVFNYLGIMDLRKVSECSQPCDLSKVQEPERFC